MNEILPNEILEKILNFVPKTRRNYLNIQTTCILFNRLFQQLIDYSIENDYALKWALVNNNGLILRYCLYDEKVDPYIALQKQKDIVDEIVENNPNLLCRIIKKSIFIPDSKYMLSLVLASHNDLVCMEFFNHPTNKNNMETLLLDNLAEWPHSIILKMIHFTEGNINVIVKIIVVHAINDNANRLLLDILLDKTIPISDFLKKIITEYAIYQLNNTNFDILYMNLKLIKYIIKDKRFIFPNDPITHFMIAIIQCDIKTIKKMIKQKVIIESKEYKQAISISLERKKEEIVFLLLVKQPKYLQFYVNMLETQYMHTGIRKIIKNVQKNLLNIK